MLPDAGYRLKWVYGVEAFQRWAKLRNQPILTAAPEGNPVERASILSSSATTNSSRSRDRTTISCQVRSTLVRER